MDVNFTLSVRWRINEANALLCVFPYFQKETVCLFTLLLKLWGESKNWSFLIPELNAFNVVIMHSS